MNIAYVRVSTVDQNEARQVEALKKYSIEKWFTEKISAKDTKRPQLQAMIEFASEGDTIHIHDFSRLARSTEDLLSLVRTMQEKGINLVSNKEQLDTSTPTGKLMLTMIGAINEFERSNLQERQREGIAIAKKEGKYKGRQPVKIKPEVFAEQYARYLHRELTKAQLAKVLGVTRPTLDKLIKENPKVYTEIMGGLQEALEFEQGKRELRTKVVKNLDHYMSLNYKIEINQDEAEGGYVASIPELKGCITCAKDRKAAIVNIEDAKREWIAAALESGLSIPEPIQEES